MGAKTLKSIPSSDHGARKALVEAGGSTVTHNALAANASEIAAQLRGYVTRAYVHIILES